MRIISRYPLLTGIVGGILLGGMGIVIEVWFPWFGEAIAMHKRLVQGIWFTAAFFAVALGRLWRFRRRVTFWASMSALFLLHSVGLALYTIYIQPVRVWQWILIYTVESLIVFLVLVPSLKSPKSRLGRMG
jgi:hypothetical protein